MNAMHLDWSDLRVFLAVARAGTLSDAALALAVDGSTVQRRIGRLEQALNARLFDRNTRGFALTGVGEELVPHAEALENEIQTAMRKVGGRDQELHGVIRLETVLDVAVHIVPEVLSSFRQAHPGVSFEITCSNQVVSLARAPAHVAIRMGPPPNEPDLVVQHVGDARAMLYARQELVSSPRCPRAPEALQGIDTIRPPRGIGGPDIEAYLDAHTNPEQLAVRCSTFTECISLLRAHTSVGFLPCWLGDDASGLARVPGHPSFVGGMWVVYHVDMRRNARVRAFVEHAVDQLRHTAPKLDGVVP